MNEVNTPLLFREIKSRVDANLKTKRQAGRQGSTASLGWKSFCFEFTLVIGLN